MKYYLNYKIYSVNIIILFSVFFAGCSSDNPVDVVASEYSRGIDDSTN
jgi:hypothetical protein